jgi:hypothetical protein
VYGAVGEFGARCAARESIQHAVMRDPAERHDGAQAGHFGKRRHKKLPAGGGLRGGGLVAGRHTTHRIDDPAAGQDQAIVRPRAVFAPCQAAFDEGGIEQFSGMIAGEGPARPVGAAQARRKPDNGERRIGGTECRDRRIEPAGFLRAPSFAKFSQSRTERAIAARPHSRRFGKHRVNLDRNRRQG